jgi:hypothetical protein
MDHRQNRVDECNRLPRTKCLEWLEAMGSALSLLWKSRLSALPLLKGLLDGGTAADDYTQGLEWQTSQRNDGGGYLPSAACGIKRVPQALPRITALCVRQIAGPDSALPGSSTCDTAGFVGAGPGRCSVERPHEDVVPLEIAQAAYRRCRGCHNLTEIGDAKLSLPTLAEKSRERTRIKYQY